MTVELKYQNEVDRTLDIEIEGADKDKAIELLHKGVRMTKVDDDYAALRKEKEALDNLFQAAKTNDEAFEKLKGHLEAELGRQLTVKEEKAIDTDDDEADSKIVKIVEDLKKEIADLKKEQVNNQNQVFSNELKKVNSDLKSKYDGKNGYPVYNAEDVAKYIEEKQFYLPDIKENYEEGYLLMNREKIKEVDLANATKTEKERKAAIDKARSETGDDSATDLDTKKKPISKQSFEEIEAEINRERVEKGESFFVED
jgi:hypothetical protein